MDIPKFARQKVGVSKLRELNRAKLKQLQEALLVCEEGTGEPLVILMRYEEYMKFQKSLIELLKLKILAMEE